MYNTHGPKDGDDDSSEDLDGLYRFIYELLLRYWEEEALSIMSNYLYLYGHV